MLCTRCKGGSSSATRRVAAGSRPPSCERCGAAIIMVAGVAVGVDDASLALLARFGLANMAQPLLEPRPRQDGA
jgi:hypothetical protein